MNMGKRGGSIYIRDHETELGWFFFFNVQGKITAALM